MRSRYKRNQIYPKKFFITNLSPHDLKELRAKGEKPFQLSNSFKQCRFLEVNLNIPFFSNCEVNRVKIKNNVLHYDNI